MKSSVLALVIILIIIAAFVIGGALFYTHQLALTVPPTATSSPTLPIVPTSSPPTESTIPTHTQPIQNNPVIGSTYDQVVARWGAPVQQIQPANQAAGTKTYLFRADGFDIYALFNRDDICFEAFTSNNRTLPDPSLFLGSLASTSPKELLRIPLRAAVWQYGTGDGAIIYETHGLPGDLSAEAYSKTLMPG